MCEILVTHNFVKISLYYTVPFCTILASPIYLKNSNVYLVKREVTYLVTLYFDSHFRRFKNYK